MYCRMIKHTLYLSIIYIFIKKNEAGWSQVVGGSSLCSCGLVPHRCLVLLLAEVSEERGGPAAVSLAQLEDGTGLHSLLSNHLKHYSYIRAMRYSDIEIHSSPYALN